MNVAHFISAICASAILASEPADIVFRANLDGTDQRYVELLPAAFDATKPHDVVVAFHGHGSDRWQFIKDARGECRGVRDAATRTCSSSRTSTWVR